MNKSDPIETLADQLLAIIRTRTEQPVQTKSLLKKLQCDLSDFILALSLLKKLGYIIRIDSKVKTVTFVSPADSLTTIEIQHNLQTKSIGKIVHAFGSVKSTNDIASELAESGAPEGTIVTAERQTAGRGRMGRSWHSPDALGIYLSIILRPKLRPDQAPGLSVMTSLALADSISYYLPDKVKIKWPNDVLISGKKVAGILTELSTDKNGINYLIVGVGINVNQTSGMFPDDIKKIATSIRRSLRRKLNRAELVGRFLTCFEREYKQYQKSLLKKSRQRLLDYSSLIDREISLTAGKEQIRGTVVDFDSDGTLILLTSKGKQRISSGEVSIGSGNI